jgi:Flp pilus assembly protein TadD
MRKVALSILCLCPLLLASCQSPRPTTSSARDYQTLGKEPQRDTDTAHKQNDAAVTLINKGDYAGAEKLLREALADDVMYGPAHNNLGLIYFHQSKLYLAAWEFQYASKLMPTQPEARNNLGLVFEASGKLDQAIDAYDQAIKIAPDNAQFIGNCARARMRRGDKFADVRPLLEKLVTLDTRPDWTAWAKEHLALVQRAATQASLP